MTNDQTKHQTEDDDAQNVDAVRVRTNHGVILCYILEKKFLRLKVFFLTSVDISLTFSIRFYMKRKIFMSTDTVKSDLKTFSNDLNIKTGRITVSCISNSSGKHTQFYISQTTSHLRIDRWQNSGEPC